MFAPLPISVLTKIFVRRGMQTQTHANSLPKRKERGSQHGERCPHKDLPHKIPRDRLYSDPTGAQPSSPLGNFYRRIKVCSMYVFFICVCVGGGGVIQSRVYHITSQRMNLCIIYSGVSRNS